MRCPGCPATPGEQRCLRTGRAEQALLGPRIPVLMCSKYQGLWMYWRGKQGEHMEDRHPVAGGAGREAALLLFALDLSASLLA